MLVHHENTKKHRTSAVFSIEEVSHGVAPGGVRAFVGLQRIGGLLGGFFFAAVGAAVGEAGLAGLEFELFAANYAGFDGIGHEIMIPPCGGRNLRTQIADLRLRASRSCSSDGEREILCSSSKAAPHRITPVLTDDHKFGHR